MKFTDEGSVVLTKAEVRALIAFAPKAGSRPPCEQVLIERRGPSGERGRAVATDGHALLILEPSCPGGAAGATGPNGIDQFCVPIAQLKDWLRLLKHASHLLEIDFDDCIVQPGTSTAGGTRKGTNLRTAGTLTANIVDEHGGRFTSPMRHTLETSQGQQLQGFPPYNEIVPKWMPPGDSIPTRPVWLNAELLHRFKLVQKAVGVEGIRLQLDFIEGHQEHKSNMARVVRLDSPENPTADCWATGVICGMGFMGAEHKYRNEAAL